MISSLGRPLLVACYEQDCPPGVLFDPVAREWLRDEAIHAMHAAWHADPVTAGRLPGVLVAWFDVRGPAPVLRATLTERESDTP
jgi:hypothetical protein